MSASESENSRDRGRDLWLRWLACVKGKERVLALDSLGKRIDLLQRLLVDSNFQEFRSYEGRVQYPKGLPEPNSESPLFDLDLAKWSSCISPILLRSQMKVVGPD